MRFKSDSQTLFWLKECVQSNNRAARFAAVRAISNNFSDDLETFSLLEKCLQHKDNAVRRESYTRHCQLL